VDRAGNIFVADWKNNDIRKITPGGVVTTLAGAAGLSGSADGTGAAASFNGPTGVAADGLGNILVADGGNNTIRKITSAGVVTTLAGTAGSSGNADGTGAAASFRAPQGIAVDGSGDILVADSGNNTIRKITSAGAVTTLAGTAGSSGAADGTGSAASFRLSAKDYISMAGLAVDGSGDIFVADTWNDTIRKITPAGVVTTLAGTVGSSRTADGIGPAASFNYPNGVAVDGTGNVFVADSGLYSRIRKITPTGAVTTLAGTGMGSADGTGAGASFNGPEGVALDGAGNLFIADSCNGTIRKITLAGM
jgi:sugar lactone lactonase YvrE